MRIPTRWFDLLTGDMVHSTIPLHRIEKYTGHMGREGYEFSLAPTPTGYLLTCVKSPNDAFLERLKADVEES